MAVSLDERLRAAAPTGSSRASRERARRTEHRYALLFLSPQLFGLIAFMIGPLIFAIGLSFTHWDGFGQLSLAGLSNYEWAFTDPQIRRSTLNTLWFTALQVPSLLLCGLVAAFVMQRTKALRGLYRTLFFAWAGWMAVALVGWLMWAFHAWKTGGLWRSA